jgi:hypothetical protein
MDNIKNFKQKIIDNYIYRVIENGYIDVKTVKSDLKIMLEEEPAVELKYVNDTVLNEDGREYRENEKLHSIIVYYTYMSEQNIPHFDKCEYIINI